MSYEDAPRTKPGAVEECCSCVVKTPRKGQVDIHLELGKSVPVIKYWCANCGLYLSTKDQDHFFPSPYWVDNRPPATEEIEDA